ncbi:MAG: hypothetical protein OET81_13715 [Desulfobacteraceae bacterium]|nr:hypothetical protein [Desulfobacteraceae bacterium]
MKFRGNLKIIISILLLVTSCEISLGMENDARPEDKILLVGSDSTKNSFHGRYAELVYTEVFRRMGYSLVYVGYPAKRSSYMSDSGKAAGEIHRVFSYGEKHPNLIRVDEPHNSIIFSAFGMDPDIKFYKWESLKGTDFRIGYRRGVKKCESKLPLLVPRKQLMSANTVKQGLNQLLYNRTKIFVGIKRNIEEVIKADHKYFNIHQVGLFEETTVHLFFHKKWKSLVPKVASTLRQLNKEGLFERYEAIAEEKKTVPK